MKTITGTVTIKGEFTAFELAALTTFMRGLDSDERHWQITVSAPAATLAEMETLVRQVMPELPGRTVPVFTTHRKQ